MSFFSKFLKLMPGSLVKIANSNNWKLAKFYSSSFDKVNETFSKIDFYRNIDNAKGNLLDKLGEKYGVRRGPADDSFYRMMIKAKVANRKGDTTVNGVLRTMQNALGISVRDVRLRPVQLPDGKREPLAIRLNSVPMRFARSEYEQEFMIHQIESIIAAGVRLQDLQFTATAVGHFELGTTMINVETVDIDDSKDYNREASGSFNLGNTIIDVKETELTDQYDTSVETNGKANLGTVSVTAETYQITTDEEKEKN
ncbi:hypothetical protein H5S09_04260 [Limosilactobacillus sp. STM2_1]|uniref:Uncharacterized protein n=1 Tax=Limosilactobacillus rudii TaxID=2759755 RepID=A0A7W3YNC4_9LACO|nr:hypothetical protein [Limosilactobacillus rudii]MBB1078976.1 hypothetical protein [Limosilactobacillus rudii]MBB1097157.1 hypothetical protein [Limosilactobacillus rudii]MCD7134150.1 hypothetical protein [Limosilactobacillus rudii]